MTQEKNNRSVSEKLVCKDIGVLRENTEQLKELRKEVLSEEKEIKIGCKFCHYKFDIFQIQEYIDHLWRFHIDKTQNKLEEEFNEVRRIRNIPK